MKKELNNIIIKNKVLEEKVNMLQIELNKEKLKYTNLEKEIKAKEISKKLAKNSKENLYEIIFEKDNEIEELKSKIKQYPVELKEGEEMISIIINSFDDTIYYSIICKNTDDFYKIEKEFYKTYSQYSETNNI